MSDAKEAVAKAAVFFLNLKKRITVIRNLTSVENTKNELVFQEQTCLRRETYRIQ